MLYGFLSLCVMYVYDEKMSLGYAYVMPCYGLCVEEAMDMLMLCAS